MKHHSNELNRTPDSEASSRESTIRKNSSMMKVLTAFILIGAVLGAVLGWASVPEMTLSNQYAFAFRDAATGYKEELIDFILNGAALGSIGGLLFAFSLLTFLKGVNNLIGEGVVKAGQILRRRRRVDTVLNEILQKVDEPIQSEVLLSIGEGIYIRGEIVDFDKHTIIIHSKQGEHTICRKFIASISALQYEQ